MDERRSVLRQGGMATGERSPRRMACFQGKISIAFLLS